jgi:ribosomal-protein-alanine N-acetyltransferase
VGQLGSTPSPDVIHGENVDLVLLSGDVIDAVVSGKLERAESMVDFTFPEGFPDVGDLQLLRFRRAQLKATPSWAPWLARGVVRREDRALVGLATFHGPPGFNDLAAIDAAELGYAINPRYRNRGYATDAARAMFAWAQREHGITHFVSGIAPDNGPSLRVIDKLGFSPTGIVDDGELIFELHVAVGASP